MVLKIRRFLYLSPLLSLPLMCTFETGFLLYLLSSSMSLFVINYTLATPRMKKLLKIPEFLPGTKLEKLVIFINSRTLWNTGMKLSRRQLKKSQ
jgi:hypothetical protein